MATERTMFLRLCLSVLVSCPLFWPRCVVASSLAEDVASLDGSSLGETTRTINQEDFVFKDAVNWTSANFRRVRAGNLLVASVKDLNIQSFNRPCCVSWGHGHIDCFIRSLNTSLLQMTIEKRDDGTRKYTPQDIGGAFLDDIECVSSDVGITSVFMLGWSNEFEMGYNAHGTWKWVQKQDRYAEVASCSASTTSDVECMARGVNGGAVYFRFHDGDRVAVDTLPGMYSSPFECTHRDADRFHCYAARSDNKLCEKSKRNDRWDDACDDTGWVTGRPSVTAWGSDRVDVFVRGVKDEIQHRSFRESRTTRADLGGRFETPPECVTTGVDEIHCFAIGEESHLYVNLMVGEKWSGWESLGNRFLEQPSCVVSGANEVSCYLRHSTKNIVELVFDMSSTTAP